MSAEAIDAVACELGKEPKAVDTVVAEDTVAHQSTGLAFHDELALNHAHMAATNFEQAGPEPMKLCNTSDSSGMIESHREA